MVRVRIYSFGYSTTLIKSGVVMLVTGYLFQMYLMPDSARGMADVIYATRLVMVMV